MIQIHDHPRLIRELQLLRRNANDKIDHPEGEHDDIVNAFAIAIAMLGAVRVPPRSGRVPGSGVERLGYAWPVAAGRGPKVIGSPKPTSPGGPVRPFCTAVQRSGFATRRWR